MNYQRAISLSIELMATAEAVYLSTVNTSGFPETRAMLNLRNSRQYPSLAALFTADNDGLRTYFTTNTSSLKVNRIEAEPKVCAYYCRPNDWRGLTLWGMMEIITEPELKQKLWQEDWTIYYPGGYTDPDYTIMRLQPTMVKGYHQLQTYQFELR